MSHAIIEAAPITASDSDINTHQLDDPMSKNRFFDPPRPEMPDEVFGIDSERLARLGSAIYNSSLGSANVRRAAYAARPALEVLPLIDRLADEDIGPAQVRPYRGSIKKLDPGVEIADGLACLSTIVGVGIPARRALNRKIEREFPERATKAIAEAREAVEMARDHVEFVANFKNPKQQFAGEVAQLRDELEQMIDKSRLERLQQNQTEAGYELPTPRGFAGLINRAVRRLRKFFGFFSRRRAEQNTRLRETEEVTAYDVEEGVTSMISKIVTNIEDTAERLPMIHRFLVSNIPDRVKDMTGKIAFVAPEILNVMYSLDSTQREDSLRRGVARNQHELRFITDFRDRYGKISLRRFQSASRNLLPAIYDVLPSTGHEIRDIYERIVTFVNSFELTQEDEDQEDAEKVSRVRRVLGRFRKG